ncbi:STE/STE20/FRAY protein kinase [Aphanomyces astaci]|uniref:STE/STE20/FRAY protein kinase n=1 Tax=Aphanomyces astaci TaxID=112090 RepID=W4GC83_APHAT|nr:STE/STE20/FRAY protein kinase [Aphanomyces astaci]ETV77280.1 STE/STE20/FRAY protein kinase [Aphanomyces astaci]|eukprot:XP_009833067.1 STE/STE20/FRAY protein kinase [Aphanomyces astaci]
MAAAAATHTEWPTSAEDYQIIEKVGQGAFAKVMKAYCRPKDTYVAIKIMDLEKITTSFEDIRAEVQTMKMTNHPNVLKCYCSFVYKDQLWLVMQLMNKGSCLHAMNILKKKGFGEGMKEELCAVILRETLQGLQYFHENGQIHRDIKAGNILLDGDGNVLIADFGVSGWMMEGGDRRKNRQTFVGTPCWMAPEVMEQVRGYDYKADIWSFGITALELAKGYAPYARYQPMKVLLLTLQEDPPSLRSYDDDGSGHQFSRHFKDMVRLCLQKDPAKRPTTSTLLKHNFFKKAETAAYLAAELTTKIDDIGETSINTQPMLPGMGPLYATKEPTTAEPKVYVPGTTWVFEDTPAADATPQTAAAAADEIDDFERQFLAASGGESVRKPQQ